MRGFARSRSAIRGVRAGRQCIQPRPPRAGRCRLLPMQDFARSRSASRSVSDPARPMHRWAYRPSPPGRRRPAACVQHRVRERRGTSSRNARGAAQARPARRTPAAVTRPRAHRSTRCGPRSHQRAQRAIQRAGHDGLRAAARRCGPPQRATRGKSRRNPMGIAMGKYGASRALARPSPAAVMQIA